MAAINPLVDDRMFDTWSLALARAIHLDYDRRGKSKRAPAKGTLRTHLGQMAKPTT